MSQITLAKVSTTSPYNELFPVKLGEPSTPADRAATITSGINCLSYNPDWEGMDTALYGLVRAVCGEIAQEIAIEAFQRNVSRLLSGDIEKSHVKDELLRCESWIANRLATEDMATGAPHYLPALILATYVQEALLPLLKPWQMLNDYEGFQGIAHYAKEAFPWLCIKGSMAQVLRYDRVFGIEEEEHVSGCASILSRRDWERLEEYRSIFPHSYRADHPDIKLAVATAISQASSTNEIREIQDRFPILAPDVIEATLKERIQKCLAYSAHQSVTEAREFGISIDLTPTTSKIIEAALRSERAMLKWCDEDDRERHQLNIDALLSLC